MNFYNIVAFGIAIGVFFYGLILSSDRLGIFYDYPSVVIVIGGTFAAAAMGFQIDRMITVAKVYFRSMFKNKKAAMNKVVVEVITSAESFRKGEGLQTIAGKTTDFFLKESLLLLNDGIIQGDDLIKVLEDRNDSIYFNNSEDAGKIKILGKYPPAFGMMGTTMGMIVLLANLSGADAIKKVGPAMGVCLITTLYGTVIANIGFLPAADNMVEQAKETYLKNKIIIEGIRLMRDKTNPMVVAEKLNSYLRPSERVDWKTVLGMGK